MKEQKEAERILKDFEIEIDGTVEVWLTKAVCIKHVNGIIEALEHKSWENVHLITYYQKVKEIIEKK